MKFCALTPYNLDRFSIPKIEPVFDRQALTIISGFIQWNRGAGNDNIPFVPKCAGESPLDRVVGMIPGDVLSPRVRMISLPVLALFVEVPTWFSIQFLRALLPRPSI